MRECSVCGVDMLDSTPPITLAGAEVFMCHTCMREDIDPETPRLPKAEDPAIDDVLRQAENGNPRL